MNKNDLFFPELNKKFELIKEISRGGYGIVYLAKNSLNEYFAIKMLFSNCKFEIFMLEVYFYLYLKNSSTTPKFIGIHQEKNRYFIILEYFHYNIVSELFLIKNLKEYKKKVVRYLLKLSEIINIIHNNYGIIHRDIKFSNYLYNFEKDEGVLIDFGLCEISDDINLNKINDEEQKYLLRILKIQNKIGKNKHGTEGFMPLEMILGYKNQKYFIDIWSFGIIFLSLIFKRTSIFTNLFLFYFEKKNNKYERVDNSILSFIIQLSIIFGKNHVTNYLKTINIELVFPKNIETFSISKILNIYDEDNNFKKYYTIVINCLKLGFKERINSFELYNEIKNIKI